MNDDGDGVKGDRQFDKRDAILATGLESFVEIGREALVSGIFP